MNYLLATNESTDTIGMMGKIGQFFDQGGIFMVFLLICSVVSVAVIIYKIMDMKRGRVVPQNLETAILNYTSRLDEESAQQLANGIQQSNSTLSRLGRVVLERGQIDDTGLKDAVQATAREEIVKLQGGIQVLEVVIVIAPLLGLLGTASGLFTVFQAVGEGGDIQQGKIGQGIAEALTTTIAGLAVAVPAVIAHTAFNRKIEIYASRLEVVMEKLVGAVRKNGGNA